ncbi:MAG: hypothetical protein KFH87_11310 [Bacteroidetes bacterium]|nr:hypothetical protein [Bacteroidota bacterium]
MQTFTETTGVVLELVEDYPVEEARLATAELRLSHLGKRYAYLAGVVSGISRSNAHFFAKQLAERPRGRKTALILLADYLTEEVAAILRALGVQYLDMAGNAFISAGAVYIHIEGMRRRGRAEDGTASNAFGWAGLKVLFTLLCAEYIRNAPYREIANAAGVALGTVAGVMADLEKRHFIIAVNGAVRLREERELVKLWVTGYIEKLRPKLLLERYDTNATLDMHTMRQFALLGGETAAARLHHFLVPGLDTLYITGQQVTLIQQLRLRKSKKGRLEVRKQFWNFEYPEKKYGIVPPLLVYADLMAVADPRTIEAAEMVYDKYLVRYFGKV